MLVRGNEIGAIQEPADSVAARPAGKQRFCDISPRR
jgi:hypothetical protein